MGLSRFQVYIFPVTFLPRRLSNYVYSMTYPPCDPAGTSSNKNSSSSSRHISQLTKSLIFLAVQTSTKREMSIHQRFINVSISGAIESLMLTDVMFQVSPPEHRRFPSKISHHISQPIRSLHSNRCRTDACLSPFLSGDVTKLSSAQCPSSRLS